jgi:hypothetical protein
VEKENISVGDPNPPEEYEVKGKHKFDKKKRKDAISRYLKKKGGK